MCNVSKKKPYIEQRTDLDGADMIWRSDVVVAASPNVTSSGHKRGCSIGDR